MVSERGAWTTPSYPTTIDLELPRWTTSWGAKLRPTLVAMGMALAFADPDFSGMTTDEKLHIDEVIHRAFVDVNERGSEAAAASAVIMGVRPSLSEPPPPVVFHADHPFLYLIRDTATGLILFMGRVVDPS